MIAQHRIRCTASGFGFTLIELVITVAVVAILAAFAYPAYTNHVRRSHRVAAQGVMTDFATRQHQFFLDTRSYATDVATLRASVPTAVAARYAVTIAAVAGPPAAFTLTATPQGSQAADSCGVLTIDQAGTKTPVACW